MARTRRPKARPTFFDGIQFRSRLEARWASVFRQLAWPFTYEPGLDLIDYIADYAIPFGIAECKPFLRPTDMIFASAVKKLQDSGYRGDAYLLGAKLGVDSQGRTELGYVSTDDELEAWLPFHLRRDEGLWLPHTGDTCCTGKQDMINHLWVDYVWREAGNRVQWKKPRGA